MSYGKHALTLELGDLHFPQSNPVQAGEDQPQNQKYCTPRN